MVVQGDAITAADTNADHFPDDTPARRGACKQKAPTVIVIGGQSAPPAKRIEKWPAAELVWRSAALIQSEDRTVLPAKQDIDADLEDAFGLLDIDWKPEGASEAGYGSADEVI